MALWADVIVFVFSYADTASLTEVSGQRDRLEYVSVPILQVSVLYSQMKETREDVPVLLVGVLG